MLSLGSLGSLEDIAGQNRLLLWGCRNFSRCYGKENETAEARLKTASQSYYTDFEIIWLRYFYMDGSCSQLVGDFMVNV